MSKSYAELLKDPRWQKIRLEVFQRADWQCQQCSDKTTELHVHHTFYDGREPWEYPENSLKCLCKTCHNSEHSKKDENETIEKEGVEALCCGAGIYDWHDFGDYEARQDPYREEFLFECKKCGSTFWLKEGEISLDQIWMEKIMEEDYRAALEDYEPDDDYDEPDDDYYDHDPERVQRDWEDWIKEDWLDPRGRI